ncbi:glucose-6-phosphate isomerase [Halarcobacter ebronensis]|uniref:Glucose-6-phosphate isomerase n=1 Tax=Halarcobacter ebronensis TaxID=1462615 RepID=A0A4Q0YH28_9BACT|nr:glucose-6-phosphate isomerase [Halarcobacter ebronensis]RXJ69633.1 glucose-6-phosphate isomerase [Halarcobacter ebronensis]
MLDFEHKFDAKIGKKAKESIKKSFSALQKERSSGKIGYYNLPENGFSLLEEVEKYKKTNEYLKENLIKDIVVIGIGGSSLGTKAVYELLKDQTKTDKKLYFLENVDPLDITRTLKKINKNRAMFIVISKSGSTIETTSIFKYIMEKYKLSFKSKSDMQRVVAITDNGSALSMLAEKNSIKQFNIPLNVGGRFSVLSAVGIVPLALANFDVNSLLKGAMAYVNSFFEGKENRLLEKAYFYSKVAKQYPINVMFTYSTLFTYFNQWYVQLWAESLGKIDKIGNSVGLTPIHLIGSVDQHSFLQLIIQGPKNKTVTVIKIEDFKKPIKVPKMNLDFLDKVDYINGHKFNTLLNAECDATYETIIDENIPADCITLDKITPENIGSLILYYELLTSAVGQFFEINTYDQPGVEFGKVKLVKKFTK